MCVKSTNSKCNNDHIKLHAIFISYGFYGMNFLPNLHMHITYFLVSLQENGSNHSPYHRSIKTNPKLRFYVELEKNMTKTEKRA